MNVPDDLLYSADHEWIQIGDNRARVGITDYAQDALGDVVYAQIPATGTVVAVGESFGEVESTKSVSDVYAPDLVWSSRSTMPSATTRPPSTPTHMAPGGSVSSKCPYRPRSINCSTPLPTGRSRRVDSLYGIVVL